MRLWPIAIRLIASLVIPVLGFGCATKAPRPPMQGAPHGPQDVLRTPARRTQRGDLTDLSPTQLEQQPHLTLAEQTYGPAVDTYPILDPVQVIPVWLLPQRHESGDFAGGQWIFIKYRDARFRGAGQGRATVPVVPTLAPIAPAPQLTPPPRADPLQTPRSEAIDRQVTKQFLRLQQSLGLNLKSPQSAGARP